MGGRLSLCEDGVAWGVDDIAVGVGGIELEGIGVRLAGNDTLGAGLCEVDGVGFNVDEGDGVIEGIIVRIGLVDG